MSRFEDIYADVKAGKYTFSERQSPFDQVLSDVRAGKYTFEPAAKQSESSKNTTPQVPASSIRDTLSRHTLPNFQHSDVLRRQVAEGVNTDSWQSELAAKNPEYRTKIQAYMSAAPDGMDMTAWLDGLSATGQMDAETKTLYDAERTDKGQDPMLNYTASAAARVASQKEQELEDYRKTDEHKQTGGFVAQGISGDPAGDVGAAIGKLISNLFTTGSATGDTKEGQLRAEIDYYKNLAASAGNQKVMQKDLHTIFSWPEEDRQALETIFQEQNMRTHADGMTIIKATKQLEDKYGAATVKELLETWTRYRNEKENESFAERGQEDASLLNALGSIPVSVVGSVTGALHQGSAAISDIFGIGPSTGRYTGIDPNLSGTRLSTYAENVVQGEAKNVGDWAAAAAEIHGADEKTQEFAGKAASTVFTAGIGALENIARVYAAGGVGSLALATTSGFSSAMRSATQQGATPAQALGTGLVSGFLEVATEKLPLDNLLSSVKKASGTNVGRLVWEAIKQAGIEVTTEEANFLGGVLAEAVILREKSGYRQTVADLVASGMAYEQAVQQANEELISEAGQIAVQTAISGFMTSAGTSAMTQIGAGSRMEDAAEEYAQQKQSAGNFAQEVIDSLYAAGKGKGAAPSTAQTTPALSQQDFSDILDESIAKATGAPADPVAAAVEGFAQTGTVSNKQAKDIMNNTRAIQLLVKEAGLKELSGTASQNRESVKQAVIRYAQQQVETATVDTIPNTDYDNIITQGGNIDAEGLQQNDRAGSIGYPAQGMAGVQPANRTESEGRSQPSGVALDSGVLRISNDLNAAQQKRGTPTYPVRDTTSAPESYEQALIAGRNSDTKNGWCVTPKSAQELREGNVRTFMNDTGTVGVGIASDGDIVAVFKNQNGGPRKAMDTMMPIAIERGGDRLDCYGEGLVKVYSRYGFVPVARVEFNPEYANDGWTPDKGTPYIYVMMHNGDSAATVVENMGNYPVCTQSQLDALPTYSKDDYDAAMAYRDSLMDQRTQQRNINDNDGTPPSSPNESVGAADQNFTGKQAYYDLLSDDNVKPGREGDVRNVEVPDTDGHGRRVSDFVTNAVGAKSTSDEMASAIEELVGEGVFGFDIKTDKSLFEAAAAEIKKDKLAGSRNKVTKATFGGRAKDSDIAKALLLYNIYNSKGDIDNASEIMVDLATMANDAGRKLRLFGLLRKMTPEGQLSVVRKGVQKSVDRINSRRSAKHQAAVTIPAELEQAYEDAARRDSYEQTEESAQAKAEAEAAIYKAVAAQIDASPMEKLNAWRYMAMLGNAKTQVRNIFGNAAFRPLVSIKRAVGAAIESVALEQKDRTKAVLGFGEDAKALVAWAKEDAKGKTAQELLSFCGYTSDASNSAIDSERQIFDTDWLESVREFVRAVPEKADGLFKNREYSISLASFIKARGCTAADIQNGNVSQTILDEGRAYAAKEALKATFNDHNWLSNLLASRYHGDNSYIKAVNVLAEGVLPFRRTPANIVARALEYSPANLFRGVINAAVNVRSGKVSASTAIDQIASGLTGSALLGLGYALASGMLGIRLRGKVDEEEELSGHQSYALEIGDKSCDISWLAPANIPLLVGANLYELNASGEKDDNWLVNLSDASVNALAPIMELSCLSSLNDIVQSGKYAERGTEIYSIVASAATSYLTQYIPTLLGQTEQAFESAKNTTYSTSDTSVERSIEKTIGRMTQKVPGIDLFQTEKVDAWGRTQEKSSFEKVFDAFLNPSKVTTIQETDVDRELARLSEAQTENVYPREHRKEITYTDDEGKTQKKVLTAEEYTKLAKAQGQQSRVLVEEIVGMDEYKSLTDTEKAKVISRVYDYAAAVSKSAVVDYHEEPSYITNRPEGMSIAEAIIRQEVVGTTTKYTSLSVEKASFVDELLDELLGAPRETKPDGSKYTNVRPIQQVEAVVGADSKLTEAQQRQVLEDILDEAAYSKYKTVTGMGYDNDDFAASYRLYLDTEGGKAKILQQFVRELGITWAAARKLYEVYNQPKK